MERKNTILLADDETGFCVDLQEELNKMGYDVITVSSMEQAQEAIKAKKTCLVILGTIMPRGDSFRLHKWLKQNRLFENIPHVVVDAPPEKRVTCGWRRDEGMRLDAEDYYSRPIKTTALALAINKILDVETQKLKVLVADDHAMVREGLRALLNLQRDIQIIGEATDGEDAVEKALHLSPDIILMDIVMPRMNGIEAARNILERCRKNIRILMLSQYDDEENILGSKKAGAVGFVSKKSVSSSLLEAIRDIGLQGCPKQYVW